jgi:hypothetical protein
VLLLSPYRLNERLRIQKGTFLVPGGHRRELHGHLRSHAGHGDHVLKIVIPAKLRGEALEKLHYMNISSTSLFPRPRRLCALAGHLPSRVPGRSSGSTTNDLSRENDMKRLIASIALMRSRASRRHRRRFASPSDDHLALPAGRLDRRRGAHHGAGMGGASRPIRRRRECRRRGRQHRAGRVARAAPDGYTIDIGQWDNHVANGVVYTLNYDLQKDFEPIGLMSINPQLLLARKGCRATT